MTKTSRTPKAITYTLLALCAVYAAIKCAPTLYDFWINTAPNELGDLRDRFREFHFFKQGLDPKKQDPLLGYPAWSYLMSGIWAWPKSFTTAKLLFMGLQTASALLVFGHLKRTLATSTLELILITFACTPIYVLNDLLSWGNYGLIQGCFFYFAMMGFSYTTRAASLFGSVIKPQIGLAVWITSALRKDWKAISIASASAVALQIAASKILGHSSIASFFETLSGGFGGKLDNFYSTGNYGFLSNLTQSGHISPMASTAICYLCWTVATGAIVKIANSRISIFVLCSGIFPLFSYHRTHDLILIWPALIIICVTSIRREGLIRFFWIPVIAWAFTFRENQPIPSILFMLITWLWHWRVEANAAKDVKVQMKS